MDERLGDDVQETRLAKIEKTTRAYTLNQPSIFERGRILFGWCPRTIGFAALLPYCHISVVLWIRGSGCMHLESWSRPLQFLKPSQRRDLRMLYSS